MACHRIAFILSLYQFTYIEQLEIFVIYFNPMLQRLLSVSLLNDILGLILRLQIIDPLDLPPSSPLTLLRPPDHLFDLLTNPISSLLIPLLDTNSPNHNKYDDPH